MAALSGMYGGWLPIGYFLWRDRKGRHYWVLLGGMWTLSWLMTYRLWPEANSPQQPSHPLRIATWNMDASHYDRQQLEKDLDFLARMGADIVCLQEVYLGDYSAECFAARAGYRYILFGKAGPAMGMAILSQYPIISHEHPLLLKGSTNGILAGEVILTYGDTIRILNVHYPSYRLGRSESWRYKHWRLVWEAQRQIDTVLEAVGHLGSERIWVCGDFNAIPFSYAVGRWWGSRLRDSYFSAEWLEGPTWRPVPLRIDYIWGPCVARHQKTYWVEQHHHAYLLAEYSEEELATILGKSATFARLGR